MDHIFFDDLMMSPIHSECTVDSQYSLCGRHFVLILDSSSDTILCRDCDGARTRSHAISCLVWFNMEFMSDDVQQTGVMDWFVNRLGIFKTI